MVLPIEVVAGKPQRISSAGAQEFGGQSTRFTACRERLQVGAVVAESPTSACSTTDRT